MEEEKRSHPCLCRLEHMVSEMGPLYLQNKVKLYMSNLTADMFLWEKAYRNIPFSTSLCNLLLEIVPQLGHLMYVSDVCG